MNKGLIAGVAASMVLLGCATPDDKYDVESWEPKTDPASMYCVEQEGKIIRVTEGENRVGYCQLSEDEQYELQEYYQKGQQAEAE